MIRKICLRRRSAVEAGKKADRKIETEKISFDEKSCCIFETVAL